jgi:hypothetical protein
MTEAESRVSAVPLGEHETTDLIPVGFEFERYGARYDHFRISTDGFIAFVRGKRPAGVPGHVRLVDERARLGAGRVTYGIRGVAPRRRLVIALAEDDPLGTEVQVTVHERTGIVEVGSAAQSFGEPTIRQLAMVQSSSSRVNSARKIG